MWETLKGDIMNNFSYVKIDNEWRITYCGEIIPGWGTSVKGSAVDRAEQLNLVPEIILAGIAELKNKGE